MSTKEREREMKRQDGSWFVFDTVEKRLRHRGEILNSPYTHWWTKSEALTACKEYATSTGHNHILLRADTLVATPKTLDITELTYD